MGDYDLIERMLAQRQTDSFILTRQYYEVMNDLIDLVRWLALAYRVVTYDDDGVEHVTWNLPVIATQDFKGKPLPDGERLAELFREVCGDG